MSEFIWEFEHGNLLPKCSYVTHSEIYSLNVMVDEIRLDISIRLSLKVIFCYSLCIVLNRTLLVIELCPVNYHNDT